MAAPGFAFAHPRVALAGVPFDVAAPAVRVQAAPDPRLQRRLRRRWDLRARAFVLAHPRLVGQCLAAILFLAVGGYGVVRGGEYDAFVEANGTIPDIVGRQLGFGIEAVTISGLSDLSEREVLRVGGINPTRSLPFLNAKSVHDRLKALPIVKDVSVTKLYPNRLLIGIVERHPAALWQKDGQVSILASDGTIIGDRLDDRHDDLPFVAGEGADTHVADYVKLLAVADDLRGKIRAGTLVAGRRWDLVLNSGLVVKLPEMNPAAAVADLVRVDEETHLLDRDIVSLDLRVPGRLVARLTDEAAASRADALAKKPGKKGGAA